MKIIKTDEESYVWASKKLIKHDLAFKVFDFQKIECYECHLPLTKISVHQFFRLKTKNMMHSFFCIKCSIPGSFSSPVSTFVVPSKPHKRLVQGVSRFFDNEATEEGQENGFYSEYEEENIEQENSEDRDFINDRMSEDEIDNDSDDLQVVSSIPEKKKLSFNTSRIHLEKQTLSKTKPEAKTESDQNGSTSKKRKRTLSSSEKKKNGTTLKQPKMILDIINQIQTHQDYPQMNQDTKDKIDIYKTEFIEGKKNLKKNRWLRDVWDNIYDTRV